MRISDWSSDVCSSDLVEILVVLLIEAHALDVLAGAEALVQLGAVADVLQLALQVGAALAGLGVLDLHSAPQAALVFDDVARADRVAVDLHEGIVRERGWPGRGWCKSARKLSACPRTCTARQRSVERRVGKEGVSTCRSWWSTST